MKCPVCNKSGLTHVVLGDGPSALSCAHCRGHWITSAAYFAWQESLAAQGEPAQRPAGSAPDLSAAEPTKPKFCPACSRFMARYRVGHGLSFTLDKCGTCGGVWLDTDEWDILRARGLHVEMHFVFSDAWQHKLDEMERAAAHEKLLLERLGPADLAEARRIRAWIDAHPHAVEIRAILAEVSTDTPGAAPPITRR